MKRRLTGWHVFAMFAGCFSVIIAVNLTLAFQAVSTFPGLVTKNSYIASQSFDADRAAQDALGWTLDTTLVNDILTLAITDASGAIVEPTVIKATLGRATHVAEDMTPDLQWNGSALTAAAPVQPGYWTLWLELEAADGTKFRRRIPLHVDEPAS
ncbi:FixH family protein [Sulfitobacter sp. F26204]|uniref:FixH family protein n=1 Tax=Sulfitobacter sp. F26204 TaxID=2996014 RepID=UPI00225E364E|nr:FixH family protein [Sulfitobacter sp. F26204]MCX7560159.1 FixH family protein [Sulfitobacter sp. F26204]